MRYQVTVEALYLGGREIVPDSVRATLTAAISTQLDQDRHDFVVEDLSVSPHAGGAIIVRVALKEGRPGALTNPLEAVTAVDRSFSRAMMRTGLFEEFDMARRTLAGSG